MSDEPKPPANPGIERASAMLSRITGGKIGTEEVKSMFAAALENREKLRGCLCHEFVEQPMKEGAVDKKYKCAACSGVLGAENVHWYTTGRKHAARL